MTRSVRRRAPRLRSTGALLRASLGAAALLRASLAAAALLAPALALAHAFDPVALHIREGASGTEVVWKIPAALGESPELRPVLPASCRPVTDAIVEPVPQGMVERQVVDCEGGLAGTTVRIEGTTEVPTDVVARVELADGRSISAVLREGDRELVIPAAEVAGAVTSTYLRLGVRHILSGFDHLLFVLGLLLIVGNGWSLVRTVTAFTVAHSITLALAVLDVVHLPSAAVEATIALSILLLAVELARPPDAPKTLTARFPWVVAFAFGLLHGFGFAGALADVGLPPGDVPLALLFFNLGVEAGQLLFVGALVGLAVALRRLRAGRLLDVWQRAAPWGIGGLAAFWCIQRVTTIFGA